MVVAVTSDGPLDTAPEQWPPNFAPALFAIAAHFGWLFLLCLTLPSTSTFFKLVRLASLPFLLLHVFRLSFGLDYTLGNPLRDAAIPTVGWMLLVKDIQLCLAYTLDALWDPSRPGGPRWIRPFRLPRPSDGETKAATESSSQPVTAMMAGEEESYEWRPVPFPPWLSWDRLVYACDAFFLKRPGTSMIFPSQGRALEWSQDDLNRWSAYLRTEKKRPMDVRPHAPVHRFGQAETTIRTATAQFLFVCLGLLWTRWLGTPASATVCALGLLLPVSNELQTRLIAAAPWLFGRCDAALNPVNFFALPLASQYLLVAVIGAAVCYGTALPEALLLKLWRPAPATAYIPAFDRPMSSTSISWLWARGWHLYHSNDLVMLSGLLPFGRTRLGRLFGTFFWSAAFHAFLLCRLQNRRLSLEPASIAAAFYDEGMYVFFLSQAAGIAAERQVLEWIKATPSAQKHRRTMRRVRRVWLFVVLFVPGRHFVDSVLSKSLMTKVNQDGFTPRALWRMLKGTTY
ncbi:hypothetical protein ACQY0O_007312 [Thecaphora frezii]